jgi:predicted TIM-barrel fold metal-dependent hydrolase
VRLAFPYFGPYDRYPLSPGRTYNPPEALVPSYLEMADALGIQRMVVVQASVSGVDNAVTLDAVRQFGLHRARAVVVIDDSFDDAALRAMHDRGVRGARFNMVSGNGTPEDQLVALALRIAPLGWHIQIYAEGEKLEAIAPL